MLESILNPILLPLLKLPSFWAILIISLAISLLITFVYKWMTDQHLMKSLKDEIKDSQKKMKEFKHDAAKVMEIQKKAMETNMKYMMHSMKPTLITFIPLIIIFGWLNAHLAYEPIMPNQEFTTSALFSKGTTGTIKFIAPEGIELVSNATQKMMDNKADWILKGKEGNYLLEYEFDNQTFNQELLITSEKMYEKPVKVIKGGNLLTLQINNEKVRPISGIPFGWLGTYIILSIVFSMALRKIMKLH
jgi:uncharacterized membrane protein (DUF106 family)